MRSHGIRGILVVAALGASSPGLAVAFDYTGQIGLGYERVDSWIGPAHGFVPMLRLDGGLDTNGYLVAPGIVDWTARAGYDSFRNKYADTDRKGDGLTYGAKVGVLDTRSSRASLAATATRARSDYSSDIGEVRSTGSAVSESYSVRATAGVPGLPSVASDFSYSNAVETGLGRGETTRTAKTFGLGTAMSDGSLNAVIDYRLNWGEGTLMPVNYIAQGIDLSAQMKPTDRSFASLSAGYFVRDPSVAGPANPRYENAAVTGIVGRQQGGSRGWLQYGYRHALTTDPSLELREAIGHTVSGNYEWRASPMWTWVGSAAASFGQTRVAAAQSSAAGQSVGLGASWTRPRVSADFGVSAGALEPEVGSAAFAYGAHASGYASLPRPNRTFSVSYSAAYRANLDATPGWSSTQSVYADVTGTAPGLLTWAARLQGSGARGGGGAFGANASRTISATGKVSYGRASFQLQVGTSDAVTGALSNPLSDGLFLPTAFDTHSRYAAAYASFRLAASLTTQAFAKYTILSGPGAPDQREALMGGSLRYAVGFWSLSLEERYSTGGTTSFDHKINELFVRASRTFGGR